VYLFLGVFLTSIVCFAQIPEPLISFEKTHHDFGKVSQDDRVSYKYKVTNKGNALLHIQEVRSTCGCTSSVIGESHLKPNENTFIEVHFDPKGMIGNVHKSLEVISNTPSNSKLMLTFQASVVKDIMPSKTVVFFDGISRNGVVSTTIHLKSGNEQPVVLTNIVFSDAPFLSCIPKKDGNDVILNVSIDGQLIPKEKTRDINLLTINTTNKKLPMMQFPIQWTVAQTTVIASPKKIVWTGAAGKEQRTVVHMKHSEGKPFRILGVKSTSPLMGVVGITDMAASEHKFDVVLFEKAKPGGYKEVLTLRLDDPEQKELEISVSAVLR